ncbi:MAG: glutamine amidotransferase [Candidatus Omnitrophota bacterium]
MRLTGKVMLLLVLFTRAFSCLQATTVVRERKDAQGNVEISVDHPQMRFVVSPANGGMVTDFVYKKTGTQWVFKPAQGEGSMGLFADHFAQQPWPGECMFAWYDYVIMREGADGVAIKLGYKVKDKNKDIGGLKIEKTILVNDNLPYIVTRVRFINETSETKSPRYWFRNSYLGMGGSLEGNYCYRPSSRGLRKGTWYYSNFTQKQEGEEFVKDPAKGWIGNVNPKTGEGVVFLPDYNYLDGFHNSIAGNTIEWFYDQSGVSPGSSWETEIITRPTSGFGGYSYASRNVIAYTVITPQDIETKVSHTICATEKDLPPVKVKTEIYEYSNRDKILVSKEETLEKVGLEPGSTEAAFLGVVPKDDILVVRVTISAEGWQETYETYYDPALGEKAFYGPNSYRVAPDKKEKDFNLPEREVVTRDKITEILELGGLYYEYYGVEKAGRLLNPDVRVKSSYYSGGLSGSSLSYFPGTAEEFYQYDLVVLNNIPAEAISYDGKLFLRHYLKQGGKVLVIGGFLSLGNGDYKDTVLEEILPVSLKGNYDLTKFNRWEKLTPGFSPSPKDKSLFSGISWKDEPVVLWYQDVFPKDGAKVLIYAGEEKKPFLTVRSYGKGKCAVINGLALGKPGNNETGFWEWSGWPKLLARLLEELR